MRLQMFDPTESDATPSATARVFDQLETSDGLDMDLVDRLVAQQEAKAKARALNRSKTAPALRRGHDEVNVSTETKPRERGILFKGPMVRAILDGRKTQTRRLVKPQPEIGGAFARSLALDGTCRYGRPGDRLWVRETWAASTAAGKRGAYVRYRADFEDPSRDASGLAIDTPPQDRDRSITHRWVTPLHMPRWASRITLEVTGLRVERLHDISEEDARAEGIESITAQTGPDVLLGRPWATAFRRLWSSINGAESWDSNPWVWVVSFRRLP